MFSYATKSSGVQPAAPTNDANFKQVAVLLHGDGTNGTQNNTFIDSSTNNFTITRNGSATQGTYTPYSQDAGYWSNYFPTASYLTVATNAAFTYGTGDFTMECWVYLTTTGAIQYIIDQRNSGTANAVIPAIYVSASDVLTYFVSNAAQITGTTALVVGTWYHVAVSRSTLVTKMFLNGVQEGSSYVDANNYAASRVVINSNGATAGNYLVGYTSNVRLVKGTAVYTTAFTPSTTPLTAITNTSLLTCQSSYFIDNSSNNFTFTVTGTPSVRPWSPFAPTSAYSTSVNGGSMYFNGTTDYLTVGGGMPSGQGTTFTLECWVYITSLTGYNAITRGNGSGFYDFGITSTGAITLDNSGIVNICVSATGLVTTNNWYHIALTRSTGNIYKIWLNGTNVATSSANNTSFTANTTIGYSSFSTAHYFKGYISNFRVTNTLVYTANFTPPTAPLTAISGTSLLLNGINAGIVDNAIKSDSITVGATQVNTSVVKYGTGSVSFNGTTSYLTFPNNTYYAFGTASWTIEAWVYTNSVTTAQTIIDTRSTATATTGVKLALSATGFPFVTVNNATLFTSSTALTISTWTHVALVKNGTTITLYLNGTKPTTGSGTSSTSLTDQNLRIGASAGTAAQFFNGYLDEVRITNGVARYTANFTAPTQAFPNL